VTKLRKTAQPAVDQDVRDGFRFRGGSLPLDFAATLGARLREQPRELLEVPGDLARWLVAAGLASSRPKANEDDLRQARALRETLYRLAVARISGKPFPDADRLALNRLARSATPAPRLEADGLSWARSEVPALLAAIARAGIELLGGPLADRVRQCEGEGCAILFVDTSRSGHRRWCSMAGCGNKAKVASFRDRNRES
jgi:predicted RNA-binding Zn ribbon-like protein